MYNQKAKRPAALLLSLMLALSLPVPWVRAEEQGQVIRIETLADWEAFAASSRLDSWSRSKVVLLQADLDLSGASPVPTFGGTFDGQGHTLSGVHITDEGSHLGLFRYNQEGAVIRDLHVKGRVIPKGDSDTVGGIVGVNFGVIDHCSFEGFLTGDSAVGGLAGFNGATGHISNGTNCSGVVSGAHSTGGIVGVNYGSVIKCSNYAQVNTQESSITPQVSSPDWGSLNSTENMPACTDTGGVAGYSSGVVKDCINSGTVGYPHTGYNVGGVAGRQAGYLSGCTNSGLIQGRKEVGGIVGQMEPYTVLRYQEDTLQKLSREMDVLNSRLRAVLDSTDLTRQQLSHHLTTITGQTDQARDSIQALLDEVEAVGDGTVDTANALMDRIHRMLEQLVPVSDELTQASDRMGDALDRLEYALAEAARTDSSVSRCLDQLRSAFQSMTQAVDALHKDLPKLSVESKPEDISAWLDQLSHNLDASMDLLSSAFQALERALEELDRGRAPMQSAMDELKDALELLSTSSSHVTKSLKGMRDTIQGQSELPKLELPKLSPDFHVREEALNDTLSTLTREIEAMNQAAARGGDTMSDGLRRVSDQFAVINRVLRDAEAGGQEPQDRVVDLSEEDLHTMTQGKVENCQNTGRVEGDLNVGGITGSMAIEYDFDPEDDIHDQGTRSLNYQYLTRVVLSRCINRGSVTARKDSVGGLAGHMDMGVLVDCESYGPVESVSGSCIGGAAGSSRGLIRDCWVKCSLTGTRRVGGVAGTAQDVKNCGAMVELREGISFLGAICGEVEPDSLLSGNTFVSDTLGGIDGVSYAGKAAPLSYEEFMQQPGVPKDFQTIALSFTAEGRLVGLLHIPYGGCISTTDIPQVPERAGYSGYWADFDREHLFFDTQVEACYTPALTVLSSPDGALLLEGSFSPNAQLTLAESGRQVPADQGKLLLPPTLVTASEPFTALRVAVPEKSRHAALLVRDQDGTWEKAEVTQEGSFLRAECTGSSLELCLVQTGSPVLRWLLPLGAVLAAAGLLPVLRRRRHKKPSPQKTEEKAL